MRGADDIEVDHLAKFIYISGNVVVAVSSGSFQRTLVGSPADATQSFDQKIIGVVLYPLGCGGIGRAATGRIVLEAAVLRWIVRRRNYNSVSQPGFALMVVGEDGVR